MRGSNAQVSQFHSFDSLLDPFSSHFTSLHMQFLFYTPMLDAIHGFILSVISLGMLKKNSATEPRLVTQWPHGQPATSPWEK